MSSYAQLAMAAQEAQDRAAFKAAERKESSRRGRAAKAGGWGRLLGMGLAGLATGGMAPLVQAGLIGLGGLAGRSIGRAAAGGRERDADKNIDALFRQGDQEAFKENIEDYQKGTRERMLVDAGKDAFSAFTMAKYFKPHLAKAQASLGIGGAGAGLPPEMAEEIARAKGASEYLAGADAGMFGKAGFSKADPTSWARTPAASTLGPMTDPGPVNTVGPYGVDPVQQFGTDPLGANNDPLSNVPSPYSPTAPDLYGSSAENYSNAVARGQAMSNQGMLSPEIRQSLGLTSQADQVMSNAYANNYAQLSNMSLDEFDAMMNAQDGNLLDLTGGNPYQMNQQFNPYQTTPQPMTIY